MNVNSGVIANIAPNSRKSRESSPMPKDGYTNLIKNMGNVKYVVLGQPLPQNQQQQQQNQFQIQNQQPIDIQPAGHPFLRRAGLVGLGAGLSYLGLKYHRPLTKLGQKAINYASDKFHSLFNPPNETATNQIGNRGAF